MRLLGFDIETTGFDPKQNEITEIAWVIKDHGAKKPRVMETHFCRVEKEIPPEIVENTCIDKSFLTYAKTPQVVIEKLVADFNDYGCDALVSHNGRAFDVPWLTEHSSFKALPELPLIDTKSDIEYPAWCHSTSLIYLAAYHGFVNPFPHAALFDTMTMLKLLDMYDIQVAFARSRAKEIRLIAQVSYDERQLAKDAGFHWDASMKRWFRVIKECDLEKISSKLTFNFFTDEA